MRDHSEYTAGDWRNFRKALDDLKPVYNDLVNAGGRPVRDLVDYCDEAADSLQITRDKLVGLLHILHERHERAQFTLQETRRLLDEIDVHGPSDRTINRLVEATQNIDGILADNV